MGDARKVTVGETEYTLRPFKAFKALVAGDMVAKVGDEIRELLGELRAFEAEHREKNVVRLTRAQTLQRGWEVPEEAFARPEGGGEAYIDLPHPPSDEERLMFAFPKAFQLARGEVMRLLALIVISNDELRNGDINGDMEQRLDAIGQSIVYDGDVGEVVELIAATVDHVKEQLSQHGEAVGKLRAFWASLTAPREAEEKDDRKTSVEPMRVVAVSPEPEPGSPADSSTSSPAPTDGTETASSTALTGASSSA